MSWRWNGDPVRSVRGQEDLELLRSAVERMLESAPHRRPELETFPDSQKREYELIEQKTLEAVWLLKRA